VSADRQIADVAVCAICGGTGWRFQVATGKAVRCECRTSKDVFLFPEPKRSVPGGK